MDIAKLKSSIPEITPDLLRYKLGVIKDVVVKTSKQIDLKYLAISMGCVVAIYALIFLYTYISGSSTIAKIESRLAFETVLVTDIEIEQISTTTQQQVSPENDLVIEGLYEDTSFGRLPIIHEDEKVTSFRAYQQPFSFGKIDKPVISFILTDYGLSKKHSKAALDLLPKEVSFLLSPYSALPDEWVKMAREKGHEVWMMLPIQNNKTTDLGRNTIFHHASTNKKLVALKRSMARFSGYVGLGSYTDESMKSAPDDYTRLADEIYSRGVGFLELNPKAPNIIAAKAFSINAPYIKADLEIFRIKGAHNSFETLENIAKQKGSAVAVIPSYPNTIKNLAVWITKIAQSDYIVAPISFVYDLPLHRQETND